MLPKISICIPTYNRATFLKGTLTYALNQTVSDTCEILVVDNASTDDTADVMKAFQDARIRYERNSTNLGMTGNWNRCLELARGEYITIWSDDDIYYPDRIREQAAVLDTHPQVGLVYTAHHICDPTGQPVEEVWPFPKGHIWTGNKELEFLTRRCYLYSPLLRRSNLKVTGMFNTQLKYAHDWEMWLRFALCGNMAYVDKLLMAYRIHPAQESAYVGQRNIVLSKDWCLALESAFAHASPSSGPLQALKQLGYCEVTQFYLWQTWGLILQRHWKGAILSFNGALYALARARWQFVPYTIRDAMQFYRKRRANQLKYVFLTE